MKTRRERAAASQHKSSTMINNVIRSMILSVFFEATCFAAEYTWDKGAGTLDWNDPVNWSSDTKPGTADTATFDWSGLASGNTVTLGADQTIGTLYLKGMPNTITIGGGSLYGLTLSDGYVKGSDAGANSTYLYIDAPVILGAEGVIEGYGGYNSRLTFNHPISDGGNGYGIVFAARGNQSYTLKGNNTYSGDTIVRGRGFGLGGSDGAIRSSRLILRQENNNQGVDAYLWNGTAGDENSDRLGDTKTVRVEGSGGGVRLVGAATSGLGIKEDTGTLELTSGVVKLTSTYNDTGKGSVELYFSGLSRSPGTGLIVMCNSTGNGSNWHSTPKITIDGVADGILPYAATTVWNMKHIEVVSGVLKMVSYSTLPTSGGSPNTYYDTGGTTLTGSVQASVLRFYNSSSDATLDLGTHDLYLADGSIGFYDENHTIMGSGGRVVFGTQDVVLWGVANSAGRTMLISTPIATDVAGPHNIVVPYAKTAKFALTGEDQINVYSNLCTSCDSQSSSSTLEFGGSSNRSFSGSITGMMQLRKSGDGTLELNGPDLRSYGNMSVVGGRLVIGHVDALRYNLWSDSDITIANAVLEVKEGISWNARYTLYSGAILSGDGTFTLGKTIGDAMGVAPGHTIGKLTTANLTFGTGSHLDWELGTGVTTAGTDYDLLRVEGNLALPDSTEMTVNVYDAGDGTAAVNGNAFTLIEWTGTDPSTTPDWTIVNHSEDTLDTSAAVITVDSENNKIVLTGLKNIPKGTLIIVN
jgi:hypothetical protein